MTGILSAALSSCLSLDCEDMIYKLVETNSMTGQAKMRAKNSITDNIQYEEHMTLSSLCSLRVSDIYFSIL